MSQTIANYLKKQLTVRFSFQLTDHLLKEYIHHIFQLPLDFFEDRTTGEIISRFLDSNKIVDTLVGAPLTLILDTVTVLAMAVALFFQSERLFVLVLLSIPIYLGIITKNMMRRIKKKWLKAKSSMLLYINR